MSQYARKKPVTVEVMLYTGRNYEEVEAWIGDAADFGLAHGFIETLEGEMEALPGDWIIRGVAGEHYACKPWIFEDTYDLLESAPSDG